MSTTNVPANGGSAIPAWAKEIEPAFFIARPALAEALWAAALAFGKSAITVFYALYVGYASLAQLKGFDVTLGGYWHVIVHGWFAVAAPIVWGLVNGGVAGNKANTAMNPPKTP
jgi:hypothetical protein